jgi:hypothetical protein
MATWKSAVSLGKPPRPTELWSFHAKSRTHVLYPASEAALFQVEVHVSPSGNCHLIVSPKEENRDASFTLESHFWVDGFATDAEVVELRRKAKALAQHLLQRQAALL